jgi:guanyl-specific ribonuclease Sa
MNRPSVLLCVLLLAACGSAETDSSADAAADSAALESVSDPAAQMPAVESADRQLQQAQKDAAARQNEAMEQVRQAETGGAP